MRYLITGGAGFIGSHLAEALIARRDTVCVIDDLSTGRRANLARLDGQPGFRAVIDSCANLDVMTALVDECDAIFHLAAAVGVKLIIESPVRTIETNVRLTEIVLTLASRHAKPVLITSTSEVYGKSDRVPFREDGELVLGPPDKGRWSYACSKALTEFLALAYAKERRLPAVIVRLFNTVGPRQTGRHGMVVPTFVRQGLAGEPITIYGDGRQSRCFTHVTDVVDALLRLLGPADHVGQVYNVGSPHEITIRDLAARIRDWTGARSELVLVPYDQAYEAGFEDMPRRVPDLSKIARATGWAPSLGLDQILRDVIDHERAARDRP